MNKKINSWLPIILLFSGSFIYFAFFADYVEFYQEKNSLFILTGDFFRESITLPGALLVYAGKFLTTFYFYPAAGALIIASLISAIVCLMTVISKIITGEYYVRIPFVAGILLFILQSNYQYLAFNNLGILLQLLFFLLIIKYLKGYWPVILFPFWYLVTGSFAILSVIMYFLLLIRKSVKTEWVKIALILLLLTLTIWLLNQYILFQPVSELIAFPVSIKDTGSQFLLFLITGAIIVIFPSLGKFSIGKRLFRKVKESAMMIITWCIMVVSILTVSVLSYDNVNKEYFTVQKLFFQERYDEVTKYLTVHPTSNRLSIYVNNISLCETGRLNDRLFWFPQSSDGQSLFLKWEMYEEVLKLGGYFYYTTGMLNEAHRWAFENMVMKGITPEDLKMLIKTELLDGSNETAAKYNSRLMHTVFYRDEARRYDKILTSEKGIEIDPQLSQKRKDKISHDFFSITDNPYVNIELVFSADSLNRRVFEYRMAYLMLTENYDAISEGLVRLEKLGFSKIPAHLEEAALVCRMSKSGVAPDTGSLRINPQTESRFNNFLETFRQYGNNLKTAQPFLKQKFGNTFWYWAFYH